MTRRTTPPMGEHWRLSAADGTWTTTTLSDTAGARIVVIMNAGIVGVVF
ncbi:hypothetical protein [Streptomyces iconiensis]|uniref:Uncharacterized protein n=1 Tax=Streptomyces iconiensis TaxID=1384038 RepID=A0ABT7A4N8_9ACTN|nr:hypothetical protein [Streptomyces iconiensis]MDJ1136246.1 hypothetical protein [Streptomyces iconiensis]